MFTAVRAEPAHVSPLIEDVRPVDRLEWVAVAGLGLRHQLLAASRHEGSRTALEDGRPIMMWGVVPDRDEPLMGVAWLIATNRAQIMALPLLHDLMPPELAAVDARYAHLDAWSDARNTVHHRWLRWMGFEHISTDPAGIHGLPFYRFQRG